MRSLKNREVLYTSTYQSLKCIIHAEVVTRVAGSLEAGGLAGYPESEINVWKT
jgi:hypothetical protein